ncbi:energy-coupling factor ABC transporter permease [Clostridium sp. CX1]|uniref:Cobalt transport protein CbiM n=1 Tax=Clostridium tanneri TaxID=3037988 RepID=A0ABU4JUM7_9CLOT|nr:MULTISPECIES: energy-coupling factor ABC transporter permease [unclassified Clostridium]MCT8976640.1 energy-coupling factor ABC transporter permease [Clostridium sp. CX1]MDW8801853.1 energy-coupling factor ABC transporter permease [Clostridium sp. A1-XYC3]
MKKRYSLLMVMALVLSLSPRVYAMHISEGFLPPIWCGVYFLLSLPFVVIGLKHIRVKTEKSKDLKMLLGLVAAYVFVLSATKLPSVTGSSSHPTGTGFGAILFGPFVMAVISVVVLLFQAIFLAHGGITTLGANVFSMGIVGPIVSYLVFTVTKKKNKKAAVFLAAMLGDLATYITTAIQLGLAFPASNGGFLTSFTKFISIFGITQIPLAIIEGILTVVIFKFIENYAAKEISDLREV